MPQYLPLGTVNAPAQWTIPSGLELAAQAVFASFDGTGAAGAYIPTLEIVSDGGGTVLEIPQDASVAAGSSVVASCAPFLKGTPASTPSGASGLAWATMVKTSYNLASSTFTYSFVNMDSGSLVTNDATVFEEHVVLGSRGIRVLKAGYYQVWTTAQCQSNAAPAAGSCMSILTTLGSIGQEFDDSHRGGFFLVDTSPLYEASATYGWGALIFGPSNPPPIDFIPRITQNSGGTCLTNVWQLIVQVSTTSP